jgi:fatty acid desaturase
VARTSAKALVNEITESLDLEHLQVALTTREEPDERAARLQRMARDQVHRHRKEWAFIVVLVAVIAACLWGAFSGHYSDKIRTQALTIMASVIAAVLGYVTGQATKPSE